MTITINQQLGPQLVVKAISENFTLNVGAKTSSLFNGSQSTNVTVSEGFVNVTASEILNAYRAVTHDGYLCANTVNAMSQYAGVTTTALVIGETGTIVKNGLIVDSGWTWIPNTPVFIGLNGILTQTTTIGTPVRRIAWANSTTQLNLDPFPIIGV